MSARVLPMLVLFVIGASVALAALPCRTPEEAMADAVAGYFLTQGNAAARCDDELGGKDFHTLDAKLRVRFKAEIERADALRSAFFQRHFGANAAKERKSNDDTIHELLDATLVINADTCGKLRAELERRQGLTWEAVRQVLVRRMERIPPESQNLCKP